MSESKTIYIGFGYKARHGKDTAVKEIIANYSDKYDIKRYAFGDALKIELHDALLNVHHAFWSFSKEYLKLPHPRDTNPFSTNQEKLDWVEQNKAALVSSLQMYGGDFTRGRDPFYWVKQLAKQVEKDKPLFALISDVRYINEMFFIKSKGPKSGFTVNVTRIGFVDPSRDPKHKSETELDGAIFDHWINVEDGNLEELKADARYVFDLILQTVQPTLPEPDENILRVEQS